MFPFRLFGYFKFMLYVLHLFCNYVYVKKTPLYFVLISLRLSFTNCKIMLKYASPGLKMVAE